MIASATHACGSTRTPRSISGFDTATHPPDEAGVGLEVGGRVEALGEDAVAGGDGECGIGGIARHRPVFLDRDKDVVELLG